MNLERGYYEQLQVALDAHFPKGDNGRAQALMLFAEAMICLRKTIRAFGGCESCYGKGYSTIGEIGVRLNYCTCDRGSQLERIMRGEVM